jgi:hypothetical protein
MTTQADALAALLGNRWWRLCNLYRVKDENGVEVKFVPNEAQRQLWDGLHTLNVIPKARQLGFSTFIAIFILDTCLFRPNTSAGIVDSTIDDAKGKLEKIKFAYEGLPPEIRKQIPLTKENAHELQWKNGSGVAVGTSHRGGTLQILHVSEYGKISAQYPDKAREIRTGAFGTVHIGQMIFVESTAEGVGGDFHDIVKEADAEAKLGRKLSRQQFKLHFYPWHRNPNYADAQPAIITQEMVEYFRDLEAKHGVKLSQEQKNWYVMKRKLIGPDDMGREFPSYLDEAFAASVEGAYFKTQMTKARETKRIGLVPLDPSRPVNTFWDIGKDDNTSIWFHQNLGQMHHFVDYYENSGEGVEFYARILREKAAERGWSYGKHYGPHDLDNSHWILPGAKATVDVARDLGIAFQVVPRIDNKMNAIEAARNMLSMSWIDEEHCSRGIQCLDNYKKAWDERRATYRSEPLHDWASHGADAYMTGACGFTPDYVPEPVQRYGRRRGGGSAWAA